jgi:hypothetical protein
VSDARTVLEKAIKCWNDADREGWAALYTDDVVYEGPGGSHISGLADLKEKYFDALLTAAPTPQQPRRDPHRRGRPCRGASEVYGDTGTWRNPDGAEGSGNWKSLDFRSSESSSRQRQDRRPMHASSLTKSKSSPSWV